MGRRPSLCAKNAPSTRCLPGLHLPSLVFDPMPLQAAGWQVVCLESQSCLCLPVATLAEELGALMMGATEASSLRFAA